MTHENEIDAIREKHARDVADRQMCDGDYDAAKFRSWLRHDDIDALLRHIDALTAERDDVKAKFEEMLEEYQLTTAELAAAVAERDKLARERDEIRYSPTGDNHHNAEACPYCSPKRQEVLQKASAAERAKTVAFLRARSLAEMKKQTQISWVRAAESKAAADAIERGEHDGGT